MDPRSSAQDVPRCDHCDTFILHSYCDVCHVSLCKPCIGEHISDGYDRHKIVPFQERRSTLIYPNCGTHSQKNCKFQCKDCNYTLVCSSCMASETHQRHMFVEITDGYETTKKIIEKDKEELKKNIYHKYEEIAHDLENQLGNLDEGYQKLTTEISKQGQEWHREIDIVIKKMKIEIGDIKVKHRDILQKQLDEIKQKQSLISQTLLDIKEIEKSKDVSSIIEYSSKIREFSKFPPKVKVTLPTFIAKPINWEKLYSLFGQINPLSTAIEENVLSLNQPDTLIRELLDEPELVATIIQMWEEKFRSVTCLNEDQILISGETNGIKCFNMRGSVLNIIPTKSELYPFDIDVDADGNLLYSDWATRTVNKVKNRRTSVLIRLQGWRPNKMCVTSAGDLLVTIYTDDKTQSKVVRYSGSTEKQTIQFDGEGKPLYSGNGHMKYITENRNHDICVADYKANATVVVNEAGKLRWKYCGHSSSTKNKQFKPQGITTDSQSHILIADSNNHCIHILDQNGQFLSYIDNCDLKDPLALCVDNNDNLFVCDYANGSVRKIKYLK